MKQYNMKRKMAAMLCAAMIGSAVSPAAFAEVYLITPDGDTLSQTPQEDSGAAAASVQAGLIEEIKLEKEPLIKEIKPEKKPELEEIKLEQKPLIEEIKLEKKPELEEIKLEQKPLIEKIEPEKTQQTQQQQSTETQQTQQQSTETQQTQQQQSQETQQTQQQSTETQQTQQQKPQLQQLQLQQIQSAPLTLKNTAPQSDPEPKTESYGDAEVTKVSKVSAEGEKDGAIEGKVTFTSERDVVVKLYDASGDYVTDVKIAHGEGAEKTGTFAFGNLPAGEYSIEVWFSGDGYAGLDPKEVIKGVKVEVKEADPPAPSVPAGDVTAASVSGVNSSTATAKDGRITGSMTFTGTRSGVALVFDAGGNQIDMAMVGANADGSEKSGSFTIEGLPMGEYAVKFYLQGDIQQGIHPEARITKYAIIQPDELPKITLNASESSGQISASISGALSRDVDIWVNEVTYDEGGNISGEKKVTSTTIWGNGDRDLGSFANGFYKVYADYASPSFDDQGNSTTRVVSGVIEVKNGSSTSVTPSTPSILTLTGSVSKTKDSITVTVNADGGFKVVIAIDGKTTGHSDMVEIEPGKALTHTFTGLAEDTYEIYADYYEAYGASPYEETVTLSSTAAQIKATAKGGDNRVDVTITEGDDEDISVKLMKDSAEVTVKTIAAGSRSAAFEGLAAGTYSVVIDYAVPKTGSTAVTIGDLAVTNARASIAISEVAGGENKLTVKGTAQPGEQILVSAKPATAKGEVLLVREDGSFTANLVADPGTYTEVSAYYVTDAATLVSKSGSWTVSAPTAPPTITVDPVDNYSTTVVVKTGAKLAVTLKTPDSTQTLESDADGLARFSLTHKYLKGEEFVITIVYGPGSGQTVSKTVTVGGTSDYKDLEYGDYGEAVLRLTTRLYELGYPVSPTKDYNKTVREAVRLFQAANGQEADGEAGDRMQAALFSVSAIPYKSGRYPTLVRGDKGLSLIWTLQQRLKDLGYYTIKVDGIFGSGTQRAVRLFQEVNGLAETGIADNATQVLLYSSAAKPLSYGTAGEFKTLQRSSKYKSAVVPLQRRLKDLGYYSGSIDGYFGSKTYRAVRNFQNRNSLKVTGIADPLTQQVLYSSSAKKYNGTTASSSGSSSSTGYRLLYWGCRGDAVKRLQNALIDAGYKAYVRKADGIFGQWTYDAVRAYQKDHGLAVDGIAGKKTQNSLYGTNY